jgi:hypothetical protein
LFVLNLKMMTTVIADFSDERKGKN